MRNGVILVFCWGIVLQGWADFAEAGLEELSLISSPQSEIIMVTRWVWVSVSCVGSCDEVSLWGVPVAFLVSL